MHGRLPHLASQVPNSYFEVCPPSVEPSAFGPGAVLRTDPLQSLPRRSATCGRTPFGHDPVLSVTPSADARASITKAISLPADHKAEPAWIPGN